MSNVAIAPALIVPAYEALAWCVWCWMMSYISSVSLRLKPRRFVPLLPDEPKIIDGLEFKLYFEIAAPSPRGITDRLVITCRPGSFMVHT